ncbi:MAG: RNA polymerase sigma factor [Zavarzinella sp.]
MDQSAASLKQHPGDSTSTGENPQPQAGESGVSNVMEPVDVLTSAFNEYRDELISTLMYILGNRDDAQDVVQDAFLKCWRNRQQLSEIQNLKAFIFRVGLNAAKDFQRSAWKRKCKTFKGEESMIADASTTGQSLEFQEEVARVSMAISGLRTEEKEVFLLRQNGGLTYEEIAEIRHAPVGTVKTQMRSALQKLRKVLN